MKLVYQAFDGTTFDTEEDCLYHEKDSGLAKLISANIGFKWNDAAYIRTIEEPNVQTFIVNHFEEIAECLGYDTFKRN